MKQTVTEYDFHRAFYEYDRQDQFSPKGRTALFEWLEGCGEDVELDVIALCCEFTEYENLAEFHKNYTDTDTYPDLDTIADYTAVIPVGAEGFIIMAF